MSSYITKDSGQRQEFSTGMVRDSGANKLRPDLLPGEMLVRWAELMGRGAEKYGARNWEKARTQEELDRFRESAFRHFMQWFYGLDFSEDHAAAVFFNIAGAEHVKARMAESVVELPADEAPGPPDAETVCVDEPIPYLPTPTPARALRCDETFEETFVVGDRVSACGEPGTVVRVGFLGDYSVQFDASDDVGLYDADELQRIPDCEAV